MTLPPAPVDVVPVNLVRRQGDISATLLYVAPNGQPANIGGWTFTFSFQPGSSLLTASWIPPTGNATGLPMTTVDSSGFLLPGYNSSVVAPLVSGASINPGDFLYIPGAGVLQASGVAGNNVTLYNNGFPGNQASGTIATGTNVWEASNIGYTVMVLPKTVTDWNSLASLSPTRSVGTFPFYIKYDTTDPSPGPYKKTFALGYLFIQPQSDPTA